PAVGLAAGRMARVGPGATLIAGALFSALWWFDSLTHWCWYSGRVGWLVVALVVPFVLSAVTRVASGGRRLGLLAWLALLAVAQSSIREPAGVVFTSRASRAAFDLFDVLSDGYGAEGNVRTAVRLVVWVAGGAALAARGVP